MTNVLKRYAMRLAALAGLLLSVIPGLALAQSTNYETRFREELMRKVPPITTPAPTQAEIAAPAGPKASPITIAEAKKLMGLDRLGPDVAARIPGGKLGIVDLGFRGLKEWLAAHPNEARLTVYHPSPSSSFPKRTDTALADPDLTNPNTPDHGYWVYRVARAVLPDVPIYLYATTGRGISSALDPVTIGAAQDGVEVFNMSLGAYFDCQVDQQKESDFSRDLRLALVQHEAFLFIAAGNLRDTTHTWISADREDDGYVDFRTPAQAARDPGSDIEGARVMVGPGENTFYFSWDARHHPKDNYAIELHARDGTLLASVRRKASDPPGACLVLNYQDKQRSAEPALLKVKRLAGARSGTLMRVNAYAQVVKKELPDFDNLQTALAYEFRDNPFVIFVGSFGKTKNGALAPSDFSDIGSTAEGRRVPDVLGPGQLLIDGKEHDGTSFASPFLTALYATRVGYNLKNLVARTSDFTRFASGVPVFARSRFGIPDPQKVTEKLDAITGPTIVTNVTHKIEGNDLVIHYRISRCCMQDMVWYASVVLLDGTTNAVLKDAAGKPIVAAQELRTEHAGRVSMPVTIQIPMTRVQRFKGKSIRLYFGMGVRAWPKPPSGAIKVNQQPDYRFVL